MKQKNHKSTLAGLKVGSTAKIVGVEGESAVSRRLLEMGVVPGATVRVVKTAPFGCPMEIRVSKSNLAIRRTEADTILIKSE